MLKFKFNYQNNTLAYQTKKENTWSQLTEEQQFIGPFGSLGFSLDSGWMTFTRQKHKIKVFYKQFDANLVEYWKPPTLAYFKKDLPKECPVTFTFSNQDEVEKVGQAWVKKGGKRA